jgi:hypothetical protein
MQSWLIIKTIIEEFYGDVQSTTPRNCTQGISWRCFGNDGCESFGSHSGGALANFERQRRNFCGDGFTTLRCVRHQPGTLGRNAGSLRPLASIKKAPPQTLALESSLSALFNNAPFIEPMITGAANTSPAATTPFTCYAVSGRSVDDAH